MAKLRKMLTHLKKNESGQGALAIVLILLMLGAIIITPLLVFMSTGIKAGGVYESKVQEFYAADAGVEDGLWRINNDQLSSVIPNYDVYVYDTPYPYNLPAGEINNENVHVNITNVWIPYGISHPTTPEEAESIISMLIVTGKVINFPGGQRGYEIKISYDGTNLNINDIGVWLSGGFDYVPGGLGNLNVYDSLPDSVSHCGGKAIVWDVDTALASIPGGTFTFQFTGPADQNPQALSWITITGVPAISYSWDADSKVYNITSTAGSTTAEAYVIKEELRKMASAISGDYCAVGNTLLTGNPTYRDELLSSSDASVDDIPDSATVEAAYLYWSAFVKGAGETLFSDACSNFNYWDAGSDWKISSGRFQGHHTSGGGTLLTMKSSAAPDLGGYSEVSVSWNQYEDGSLEPDDCLQYAFSKDDGSTWGGWNTAFCDDSPLSSFGPVAIPQEYLTDGFKMRFTLVGFDGSGGWFTSDEECQIDNIKVFVIADPLVTFKINDQQVYFNETGEPQQGAEKIAASKSAVLENLPGGYYSYACYREVTKLVQAFCDKGAGGNPTGNGKYTVGDVNCYVAVGHDVEDQYAYAGWSLIIIYSSPETKGHQLYLYDVQTDDFTFVDGQNTVGPQELTIPISGFLAPPDTSGSRLTCFVGEGDEGYGCDFGCTCSGFFNGPDYLKVNGIRLSDAVNPECNVWNSYSNALDDPSINGIDIDTFDMSGRINPGDTNAVVTVGSDYEIYNVVYIILSFRSEITTGGTISYLIR